MDTSFRSEIALGHMLTFKPRTDGAAPLYFQNFWMNENVSYNGNSHGFLPFGFSGMTVNRSGDNQSTQLGLPNNSLSRSWSSTIVEGAWVVLVDMLMLNPDNKADYRLLSSYAGQVSGAIWSDSDLRLEVSSVLDAVGGDVPRRRITEDVFGPLPTTAQVRLG
jgi:hypothetical protein